MIDHKCAESEMLDFLLQNDEHRNYNNCIDMVLEQTTDLAHVHSNHCLHFGEFLQPFQQHCHLRYLMQVVWLDLYDVHIVSKIYQSGILVKKHLDGYLNGSQHHQFYW